MVEDMQFAKSEKRVFAHKGGRLWFRSETERKFYFFLTVLMLAFGLLYKWGVL